MKTSNVKLKKKQEGVPNIERRWCAPLKAPRCVFAALYIQSAYRRFRSRKDPMVLSGQIEQWPDPPVCKAMYSSRRRRHPEMVDLDAESEGVIQYIQLICPPMRAMAELIETYQSVDQNHEINMFLADAIHLHLINAQEIFAEEIKKREKKGTTMYQLKQYLDGLMTQVPDDDKYREKFQFFVRPNGPGS